MTLYYRRFLTGTLTALAVVVSAHVASAQAHKEPASMDPQLVYIGTYTGGKSAGIYRCQLDPATGKLSGLEVAGEAKNPSFVAIPPSGKFLYAVSEVDNHGAVTAFAIDSATGKLTALNHQDSKGAGPCHVCVDRAGRNALVANYGSGSAAVLPIDSDGRLKPAASSVQHRGSSADSKRQEGPHAHSINLDPANKFAFVADLGLDKVLVYRFDAERGTITANDPPAATVAAGAGPRHFAFHPEGRRAYVINEMASTLTAFDYDPQTGVLKELQTVSTLPKDFTGENTTAEVQVHPSGRFVYGSNRGHDSIAIFSIDAATGRLTPVGHQSTGGKTPRNFGIEPTGRFLLAANQDSDSVVAFRIDPTTGKLDPTGQKLDVPHPVCVKMIAWPAGKK